MDMDFNNFVCFRAILSTCTSLLKISLNPKTTFISSLFSFFYVQPRLLSVSAKSRNWWSRFRRSSSSIKVLRSRRTHWYGYGSFSMLRTIFKNSSSTCRCLHFDQWSLIVLMWTGRTWPSHPSACAGLAISCRSRQHVDGCLCWCSHAVKNYPNDLLSHKHETNLRTVAMLRYRCLNGQ